MGVLDWILVAIRWAHALSAVAWVGGGLFYILVLRPAWKSSPVAPEVGDAVRAEFHVLTNTAIAILLVTGIVLSASRLTAANVTSPYVAVLAVKVVLAIYMFLVVGLSRRRRPSEYGSEGGGRLVRIKTGLTSATAVLIAGIVVIGLADVLAALFEDSLTAGK